MSDEEKTYKRQKVVHYGSLEENEKSRLQAAGGDKEDDAEVGIPFDAIIEQESASAKSKTDVRSLFTTSSGKIPVSSLTWFAIT